MNIILNGEPAELHGKTVADLIAQTAPQKPFAVAVNTGFVAKGANRVQLLWASSAANSGLPKYCAQSW